MSISDERAALDERVAEAEVALNQARHNYERSQAGAVEHPAVVALREWEDARVFRKLGIDVSPERGRQLVLALCRAIEDDPDLTLTAIGASRFRVDSVAPDRLLHEAREALTAVTRERDAFLEEHRTEFEEAEREAAQTAVRDALASGDSDLIREALGLKGKALTTKELA